MRVRLLVAVAAGLLVLLWSSSQSYEAVPPNPKDPCVRVGRDSCGTTGVGFYKVYRYGVRWFGDFRGAIPGVAHTFCIDFRYWYPSLSYRYREIPAGSLVNRDGKGVPAERQRRLAYAIWTFGRTANPNRQAAVMLYVHRQVGDARAGEADPAALGPAVSRLFATVAADSALYHGPYRLDVEMPAGLSVGKRSAATIRVLAASGAAVPGVTVSLSGSGSRGLPASVRTGPSGVATAAFTPLSATIEVTARASDLASTLPRIFAPTTRAAAPNGQRLTVPASQQVSVTAVAPVARQQISVTTEAAPGALAVGQESSDQVTIAGAAPGWQGTVAVRVYGPFDSAAAIRCDRPPAWTGSFAAPGVGTYTTPAAKLSQAGWYAYVIAVPGDSASLGVTTPCGVPAERFVVQAVPSLGTAVSAQRVPVGGSFNDTVHVSGLAGRPVSVQAALYGPFPARDRISCARLPVWSGPVPAASEGEYRTAAFSPQAPGYYAYQESIEAGDLIRGIQTPCGDEAETVLVVARPELSTEVTAGTIKAGSTVADRVTLEGLGTVAVQIRLELWGPFGTAAAIRCAGTPYRVQTLAAPGNGTYTAAPVMVAKAGHYSFRASIAAGPLNDAATAPCAEAAETVVVRQKPKAKPSVPPSLTTVASAEVVRPGEAISDRIRTRGIRGPVQVQLFGPFSTRAAIRCSGRPLWAGRVSITRDGEARSPAVRVRRAGLYVFRERVLGAGGAVRLTTACALEAETVLAAPRVVTGRGERSRLVTAAAPAAGTPARVRLRALGIDARVVPVGIDLAQGTLGVPPALKKLGWWRDGALPGAASGSILVAGHLDSSSGALGAFFWLRRAKPGDRVEVETAGGRTYVYRVVSVGKYRKGALPANVWSRRGPARLVLVTCGGPFDRKLRHYRDNLVVTAVPA